MAVAATNLTSGYSVTSGTSFATASVSPAANNLILLSVVIRNGASTNPGTISATGNGLTWVSVASVVYDNSSSSRRKIEVFRAMGASPSAGAITISTSETDTAANWCVDQFSDIDTSGTNGSGAVVQAVTNLDATGTVSTLTVTLAAFGSANNATFGAFGTGGTATDTLAEGSGFTKLAHAFDSGGNETIGTEWKSTNDTTVDISNGGVNTELGGIGIEIKASTVAVKDIITNGILVFPR